MYPTPCGVALDGQGAWRRSAARDVAGRGMFFFFFLFPTDASTYQGLVTSPTQDSTQTQGGAVSNHGQQWTNNVVVYAVCSMRN